MHVGESFNTLALAEDKEFLDGVINGTPVSLGLDEARRALEIVHAAQDQERHPWAGGDAR